MSKQRRLGSFPITPELVRDSLQMPNDCKIVGAEWDFNLQAIRLFVESPELPELAEGESVPSLRPSVTRVTTPERTYCLWSLGDPL